MDADDMVAIFMAQLRGNGGAKVAAGRSKPVVTQHVCHQSGPKVCSPLGLYPVHRQWGGKAEAG